MKVFLFLCLISLVYGRGPLPSNLNCNPQRGTCNYGDFVDQLIADCEYDRSLFHPISCDAVDDDLTEWTVNVARGDRCKPIRNKQFTCGASGTNTRCVCSDVEFQTRAVPMLGIAIPKFNECRCQYIGKYQWRNEL